MVKKDNLSAYFKGKNFYISLLVGVCTVFAISAVYINVTKNKNNDLVDLNEPLTEEAAEKKEDIDGPDISYIANQGNTETQKEETKQDTKNQEESKKNDLKNDIASEEKKDELKEAMSSTVVNEGKSDVKANTAKDVVNTDSLSVMNPGGSPNLKFDEEKGLLWPVKGNVIMDYSMDQGVYYETLMQYKCNPAILIDAKVDTDVYSAAKGIVTEITKEDETGLTITMSIGNDYNLVYGQLKDCTIDVGDAVKEGDIIGKIAEPSSYYTMEGSNLYFKVVENDETVDPMLLLR